MPYQDGSSATDGLQNPVWKISSVDRSAGFAEYRRTGCNALAMICDARNWLKSLVSPAIALQNAFQNVLKLLKLLPRSRSAIRVGIGAPSPTPAPANQIPEMSCPCPWIEAHVHHDVKRFTEFCRLGASTLTSLVLSERSYKAGALWADFNSTQADSCQTQWQLFRRRENL